MRLKATDRAYIAGIIDGEGAISLAIMRTHRNDRWVVLSPNLKVSTVNKELSVWLKDRLGGTGARRNHYGPKHQKWRDLYSWNARSPLLIKAILEEIQPYLIIKREQARILLEWFRIRQHRPRGGKRGGGTTPIPERELILVKQLRELNNGNHRSPDSFTSRALAHLK